jgi:hypothetical protein
MLNKEQAEQQKRLPSKEDKQVAAKQNCCGG